MRRRSWTGCSGDPCCPGDACAELGASVIVPTCGDVTSVDGADHAGRVVYGGEGGHPPPVRMPEIRWYVWSAPDSGGHHEFSDGTGGYRAAYFSGWNQHFLPDVPNRCDDDAADPGARCEDFRMDDGLLVKELNTDPAPAQAPPPDHEHERKHRGKQEPSPQSVYKYDPTSGNCADRVGAAGVDAARQQCRECRCADSTERRSDGRNGRRFRTEKAQRCGRHNGKGAVAVDRCPWRCDNHPGG